MNEEPQSAGAEEAVDIKYGPVTDQPAEAEAEPDPADNFLAYPRPSFWQDLN